MKKKIMAALLLSSLMMAIPARADEAELLARIEALEQRVAQLEQMMGIGEDIEEEITEALPTKDTAAVELTIGNWMVGEDIAAGKYNLTAASDVVTFCSVYKDLDARLNHTGFLDFYTVASEGFLDDYVESLGNTEEALAWRETQTTVIYNVYLQDGQCIEIENGPAAFTPVQ